MMTNEMISKLEKAGAKRWTKGRFDRLYINAWVLGLECTYYNTGNISSATFKGEHISNCEGYRMKAAKTYIDIETGEIKSTNQYLQEAAEELVNSIC